MEINKSFLESNLAKYIKSLRPTNFTWIYPKNISNQLIISSAYNDHFGLFTLSVILHLSKLLNASGRILNNSIPRILIFFLIFNRNVPEYNGFILLWGNSQRENLVKKRSLCPNVCKIVFIYYFRGLQTTERYLRYEPKRFIIKCVI